MGRAVCFPEEVLSGYPCDGTPLSVLCKPWSCRDSVGELLRGDPGGLDVLIQSPALLCLPGSFGIMFPREIRKLCNIGNEKSKVLYLSFCTESLHLHLQGAQSLQTQGQVQSLPLGPKSQVYPSHCFFFSLFTVLQLHGSMLVSLAHHQPHTPELCLI